MSLLAHWSMMDVSISHTHALAHLKSKWFCATIAMQKHGLVNTLRASFNESSQRGVRSWRVSKSPLRALRDSQTLGELSNSRKARGPASEEEEEEEEEENYKDERTKHFLLHVTLFALLQIGFHSAFLNKWVEF